MGLTGVTTGTINLPEFIIIHGDNGVGKTTFGASAPSPVFIGPEARRGTKNMLVGRYPEKVDYDGLMGQIKELSVEDHEYRTLVVDSLDKVETLIWAKVCMEAGKDKIEDLPYGTGYTNALSYWQRFIEHCEELQDKKEMGIILISHTHQKPCNDVILNQTYDRHVLKLHSKAASFLKESVDTVLYATFKVFASKDHKDDRKAKARGDGARVMYTEYRPAFDAKNRDSLPFELDLSWDAYITAVGKQETESPDKIREDIGILVDDPKLSQDHKDFTKKFLTESNGDVTKLTNLRNRLRNLLSQT